MGWGLLELLGLVILLCTLLALIAYFTGADADRTVDHSWVFDPEDGLWHKRGHWNGKEWK